LALLKELLVLLFDFFRQGRIQKFFRGVLNFFLYGWDFFLKNPSKLKIFAKNGSFNPPWIRPCFQTPLLRHCSVTQSKFEHFGLREAGIFQPINSLATHLTLLIQYLYLAIPKALANTPPFPTPPCLSRNEKKWKKLGA